MDIKANAVAHFRERLSSEMRTVEVPEWGDGQGNPAVIHYKPITAGQRDFIFMALQGGRMQRGAAAALACRARYEDGKLIWGQSETQVEAIMREYDPDVVQRVATDMGGLPVGEDEDSDFGPEDLRDIEGNSESP